MHGSPLTSSFDSLIRALSAMMGVAALDPSYGVTHPTACCRQAYVTQTEDADTGVFKRRLHGHALLLKVTLEGRKFTPLRVGGFLELGRGASRLIARKLAYTEAGWWELARDCDRLTRGSCSFRAAAGSRLERDATMDASF